MGTLALEGVTVPAGLTLKVVEDTPGVRHVVLPAPPSAALSDEAVAAASGGGPTVYDSWVLNG